MISNNVALGAVALGALWYLSRRRGSGVARNPVDIWKGEGDESEKIQHHMGQLSDVHQELLELAESPEQDRGGRRRKQLRADAELLRNYIPSDLYRGMNEQYKSDLKWLNG